MRSRTRIAPLLCLLTALLVGCDVFAQPSPAPSQTPVPSPTPSPASTITPTIVLELPTQSLTPEAPAGSPTPGAPGPGELDCRLLSQSPKNGTHFAPRDRFDMGWWVRNTGTLDWDAATVDFVFAGGSPMHTFPLTHLQKNVLADQKTLLVADMLAPKQTGKYTTIWSLRSGQNFFCQVRLTIYVP